MQFSIGLVGFSLTRSWCQNTSAYQLADSQQSSFGSTGTYHILIHWILKTVVRDVKTHQN